MLLHVYDALCRTMCQSVHCSCGWDTRSKCQKLCTAGLVRPNKAISGLWRLSACAFYLDLFPVLFLLSWLLQWTTSLLFSLSELLAVSCIQHLFLHLTPPKYRLQRPSHAVLPVLCRHVIHVVSDILPRRDRQPQIDIPKRHRKLTFLSVTDTYVRTSVQFHDSQLHNAPLPS